MLMKVGGDRLFRTEYIIIISLIQSFLLVILSGWDSLDILKTSSPNFVNIIFLSL